MALVDGQTRKRLAIARAEAMRLGPDAGIALLGDFPAMSQASRVAFMMERCELLYLDHQFEAAGLVYDREIEPLLGALTPECASLLADNRSVIASASFNADGISRFYHEVDVRRLLGVDIRDYGATLEANQDAIAGKHHAALPSMWKLLLDAYRTQNWRARQWAHVGMARECMALGWPDEAVWHAVQALDEKSVRETASRLSASRDQKRITNGIDRLLMYSKLANHAALTAEFLYIIADCIPDDRVSGVVDWVLPALF